MKNHETGDEIKEYINEKKIRLSEEQINSFECFADLSFEEKEKLSAFVYNISLVLYKSFKNESA